MPSNVTSSPAFILLSSAPRVMPTRRAARDNVSNCGMRLNQKPATRRLRLYDAADPNLHAGARLALKAGQSCAIVEPLSPGVRRGRERAAPAQMPQAQRSGTNQRVARRALRA